MSVMDSEANDKARLHANQVEANVDTQTFSADCSSGHTVEYDETVPLEDEEFASEDETQDIRRLELNADARVGGILAGSDSGGTQVLSGSETTSPGAEVSSMVTNKGRRGTERSEVVESGKERHSSSPTSAVWQERDTSVMDPRVSTDEDSGSGHSQGCCKSISSASLCSTDPGIVQKIPAKSPDIAGDCAAGDANRGDNFADDNGPSGKGPPVHNVVVKSTEDRDGNYIEECGSIQSAPVKGLFTGIPDNKENAMVKEHSGKEDVDIRNGHPFAGLSYIESQEPGEFSQANALNVVDKFLQVSTIESPERESTFREVLANKSSPASALKQQLNLAQRSNPGKPVAKGKIFDWIDNREDDGGGEFFCKQRELLLGNGDCKLLTDPRKQFQSPRNTCKIGNKIGKKPQVHQKLIGLVHSDSRFLLNKSRSCHEIGTSSVQARKNISKDLYEQFHEEKALQDTDAIGFDTQQAVEAIQILSNVGSSKHRAKKCKTSTMDTPVAGRVSLKRRPKKHVTASDLRSTLTDKSAERSHITEEHGFDRSVIPNGISSPVAHRTRRSMAVALRGGESRYRKSKLKKKSLDEVHSTKKQRIGTAVTACESDKFKCQKDSMSAEHSNMNIFYSGTLAYPKQKRTQRTTRGKPDDVQSACIEGFGGGSTSISLNAISPVCFSDQTIESSGDISSRPSCAKELISLDIKVSPISPTKDVRRRREMSNVHVLFSHHLGDEIIRQQKKFLTRLGASVAGSPADATHFVADEFVRTRNMLEAMARGIPVVTHLWLESCIQASCCLDEKQYILKDQKKEKEIGFSLSNSLTRARQFPLLKGKRAFVTQNVKPSKSIVAALVIAAGGQAIKRIARSASGKFSDDFLILSSEEDYFSCLPFLEKGAEVYSSELILNGIVIQKLEYQRHRLFPETVRRTRSTVWLRKGRETRSVRVNMSA